MATEKEVETQLAKIRDLKKILSEAEALRQKMQQKKQEVEVSKGLLDSNIYFLTEHSSTISLNEFKKIKGSHSSMEKQLKELQVEIDRLDHAIVSQKKIIQREKELLVKMEHQVKTKVIPFRRRDSEKH